MSNPVDAIDDNADLQPTEEVQVVATRAPALQYLRQISCVIGAQGGQALEFKDFRVVFTVKRGDLQSPNTCDVRIYNLSDNTANQVQDEFTYIALQAGYEANFGLVFRGTVKQVRKGRTDQKDSYLDITAADGDEAYNFAPAVGALAAGYTAQDHWAFLAKQMEPYGVRAGPMPPFLSTNGSTRGRVFCGMAKDELRAFANSQGCTWSIQDGQLTLIQKSGYVASGKVPVISPQSGLIGMPEQTQNGIAIRTLLNPRLKIGQLIQLQSGVNQARLDTNLDSAFQTNYNLQNAAKVAGDGVYYVMVAEHTGDTRGNPWYTDLVCLAADATQIPSGLLQQQTVQPESSILPIKQ